MSGGGKQSEGVDFASGVPLLFETRGLTAASQGCRPYGAGGSWEFAPSAYALG
jgi:hypothetical protein